MTNPTKDQAFQFALMLAAGLSPTEAILYFTDEEDPHFLGEMLRKWTRSKEFKQATIEQLGKSWQEMSLEEQISKATDRHYAQLAYLLFSSHYGEVGPSDKAKLDTARQSLEAKQAGTAGKTDALSRFFDDINQGKLKLNLPVPVKRSN